MPKDFSDRTVREKVNFGFYDTEIPYEFVNKEVTDDMTVREARELKAKNEADKREHRLKRREDENRLREVFHRDLAKEYELIGHPKEQKLWSLAWEMGHSSGYESVITYYEDLMELLS